MTDTICIIWDMSKIEKWVGWEISDDIQCTIGADGV